MYIALLLRISNVSNLCVLNFSLVTFPLISSPLEYSWISWKTKKVLDHHLYQLPRSVSITNYLCLNQALGKLQSQTCRAKFGSNVTINQGICKCYVCNLSLFNALYMCTASKLCSRTSETGSITSKEGKDWKPYSEQNLKHEQPTFTYTFYSLAINFPKSKTHMTVWQNQK